MIIMGLVGGMGQLQYYAVISIVLYLFIVGNMLFGKRSSILVLYRDIDVLFRASTLEDWTDIKYISYFGCDSPYHDSGIYWLDDPNQNPAIQIVLGFIGLMVVQLLVTHDMIPNLKKFGDGMGHMRLAEAANSL